MKKILLQLVLGHYVYNMHWSILSLHTLITSLQICFAMIMTKHSRQRQESFQFPFQGNTMILVKIVQQKLQIINYACLKILQEVV